MNKSGETWMKIRSKKQVDEWMEDEWMVLVKKIDENKWKKNESE